MYRTLASIALCMMGFCLTGCLPSVGPCDERAALEIVYTNDGTPAFAGQAVMQLSCGNGGFCHAESGEDGIPLADRFGAPAGLGFDVGIAATSEGFCDDPACASAPENCADFPDTCVDTCCAAAPSEAAARRLLRHQQRVLSLPGQILAQVQQGSMPPPGDVLTEYRCQVTPSATGCAMSGEDQRYDRIADDGVTATRLPTLIDEDPGTRQQAEEILRNWLSCGAPVVERTVRHRVLDNFTGFTVGGCERECVDVTWPSIYERVIVPSCTSSRCHDADDPAANLDLSTQVAAYGGLFEQMAEGTQCRTGGRVRVVPGVPDDSLLVNKVEAASSDDVCGSRMPLSGSPLSEQRRCVIRQWVSLGACADPADPACSANLAAARSMCRVDPASATLCAATTSCPNEI